MWVGNHEFTVNGVYNGGGATQSGITNGRKKKRGEEN